jgi:hypothetical protein
VAACLQLDRAFGSEMPKCRQPARDPSTPTSHVKQLYTVVSLHGRCTEPWHLAVSVALLYNGCERAGRQTEVAISTETQVLFHRTAASAVAHMALLTILPLVSRRNRALAHYGHAPWLN